MPKKQVAGGRKVDPETELKAWQKMFKHGADYLQALPKIGVELGPMQRPPRHLAEQAWRRLGEHYLSRRDPDAPPCWAEREFGAP